MRIAINQPYFIPYAGFFRLLSAVDIFVIYDDVQYSSQSWVNRNKLLNAWGESNWLTIPLKDHALGTKIKDLEFAEGVEKKWQRALARIPHLGKNQLAEEIYKMPQYENPCAFIVQTLRLAARLLGIGTAVVYSSAKNIQPEKRAQERVLAICEHFGAKEYINAPGGVHLYNKNAFLERGIDLKFLMPYGNKMSILERMMHETPEAVRKDIDEKTGFIS